MVMRVNRLLATLRRAGHPARLLRKLLLSFEGAPASRTPARAIGLRLGAPSPPATPGAPHAGARQPACRWATWIRQTGQIPMRIRREGRHQDLVVTITGQPPDLQE